MRHFTYRIDFLSFWHCGSGLGAGSKSDSDCLKDANGLPFIPGKTIKGLVREAFEDLCKMQQLEDFLDLFGLEDQSADYLAQQSKLLFSNATLEKKEQEDILVYKLTPYLYRNITSISIDPMRHVAESGSLRVKEVCVPVSLVGSIEYRGEQDIEPLLAKSLKLIRSMGVNRNRGLGRCNFSLLTEK